MHLTRNQYKRQFTEGKDRESGFIADHSTHVDENQDPLETYLL